MPDDVMLVRVKGSAGKGGDAGGEAWRIDHLGTRAGVVFINEIDAPPLGRHASLQIFLNAKSQGQHIGRIAYRKACELSQYPVIHAHMRKSNLASISAARSAGFVDATPEGHKQLVMVWRRGG